MQWLIDALTLTPSLKALACNVEMSPSTLLDRQLARLAGIDLTLIRYRRLTAEHSKAIQRGTEALESLADRLAFARPPYDLANVARSADAFGADLLLLDYIQRIGAHGEHADRRGAVDATMGSLRQFADAGVAIIVVAALARRMPRGDPATPTGSAWRASAKPASLSTGPTTPSSWHPTTEKGLPLRASS